jgi:hypothetical protein
MLVTTLCRTRGDAEDLLAWLRARGYRDDELGLVLYGEQALSQGGKQVSEEQAMRHAFPMLGAASGVSVAAAVAGIALVTGPAGLMIAGPLALLLAAVGVISAGGIVGILAGAGIPNDDAERYADELKTGAVIVSVTAHKGDERAVHAFFARFG